MNVESELNMLIDFSKELGAKEVEKSADPYYQNYINAQQRMLKHGIQEIKSSILQIVGENK